MDNAVELRGVGKRYTKYVDSPMLLTAALRWRGRHHREQLWAVRNLDLEVSEGESIGVIGRNGSGKTTTMSMIAGITAPTTGSVKVRGRIAPLIAVGVGFHRELTGRENIYLNGSILGLTRRQIDRRLDEIIAFSEVERFIDTPVKFYSSGMFVRLGFAVAAHCDPDVLIIDEVLAVGDFAFQLKCYERMSEIRRTGATVVMVTHNLAAVRRMCDRVLLMHDGQPVTLGPPEEALSAFHQVMRAETRSVEDSGGYRFEPQVLQVQGVELVGEDDLPTNHYVYGDEMRIRLRALAHEDLDDVVVTLMVYAGDGTQVYKEWTVGHPLGAVGAGELFTCAMRMPVHLATGTYFVTLRLDRTDLRTTLDTSEGVAFYVDGRDTVSGVADLGASFVRETDPMPAAMGGGRE
ncbi:MAG: ABC transporter ATP-binding protein [Acidimicrobiales bacterium]